MAQRPGNWKATTIVPPGATSVRLKGRGAYITEPGLHGDAFTFTSRVLCADPGCMGELLARPGDRTDGFYPGGWAEIAEWEAGQYRILTVVHPPVFILVDGVITHIRRARPRRFAGYSTGDREIHRIKRAEIDPSMLQPFGELADEDCGAGGGRIMPLQALHHEHFPVGFRCPICGFISMIGEEVVPLTRASSAA